MLVPLSWLKDCVSLAIPVEALAERLTLAGLEVKSIEHFGEWWDRDKIRVGRIVSVRPHPNADRLVLATVDYGAEKPLEVVTGAPNVRVGDSGPKVVLATVGAKLIDPYADTLRYQTLKRSKIRGVVSEGMVCSERELGISEEHEGILVLPDDAPVGMPFVDYWGDLVLDLDLTPNLARAFCLIGVAREVAALTSSPLTIEEPQVVAEGEPIEGQIELEIQAHDLCPRYSAALIKGVRIGPSPVWMQRRLRLAGMRPINNVVDITNYVMLEWGQPLHAFDYRRLRPRPGQSRPAIIVRRAREGERIKTLDGVERLLQEYMLLITDGEGPVAIAGVMGGEESEVTESTVDILLEAANFDFISVRRTSGELKLSSEAAQRFGRGVDPELTVTALERASELMRELAGGTVAQGFADLYPESPEPIVIDLPVREVTRLLGIHLEPDDVVSMLEALGFGCQVLDGAEPVLRTSVPSYRLDVRLKADLVEEVARMYGYDRLPETLIEAQMPWPERNLELELEERVRDVLVGCGLTEIITYSLTNVESVGRLKPGGQAPDKSNFICVANPLNREQECLRQTLMNTTLETVASNLRFVDRVAVFEIARVYLPRKGELLPDEPSRLSIALCGPREPRSWLSRDVQPLDFYDLKGVVETLVRRLNITDALFQPINHATFFPGRVAGLAVDGQEIGVLGQVHPLVAGAFDIESQPVLLAELDLDALIRLANPVEAARPISRMPVLREDIAIIVSDEISSEDVARTIREAGGDLLVDVVLFDVYRGEQVGMGNKGLAYSLCFQSPERTLTSKEAAALRQRIVKRLEEVYGARLRG